jgi:hypothetical protein
MIKIPQFIFLFVCLIFFATPSTLLADGEFFITAPLTNNFTISASSTVGFHIICNENIVVKEMYQRVASQSIGTVLRLNVGGINSYATTTNTTELIKYPIQYDCDTGETIYGTINVVSGDNSYTYYHWLKSDTSYGVNTIDWTKQVVYADRGESGYIQVFGYSYDMQNVRIGISSSTAQEVDLSPLEGQLMVQMAIALFIIGMLISIAWLLLLQYRD